MAYAYFISLDIDNSEIDATLTNFPVRLYLTSAAGPDAVDFSDVFTKLGDADRKRIAIMAGAAECYVEIVYWDATAGKAILDVRVPSVSASGRTPLKLYYDPAEPENTTYVGDTGSTPAQTVWDSNFKAVYHLVKDPSATAPQIIDATGNGRNLTASGSMTSGDLVDDTVLVKAIEFDGSNDALARAESNPLSAYPATYEIAGRTAASYSGYASPSFTLCRSDKDYDSQVLCVNGTNIYYYKSVQYVSKSDTYNDAAIGANEVVYGACAIRGSADYDLFHNTSFKTGTQSLGWPSYLSRIAIGALPDYNPSYYEGKVSEARLSSVARSDAWLKATSAGLRDTLIRRGLTEQTEDMATRGPLTDGTVLEDLDDMTSLAGWQIEDLDDLTRLVAWQFDDLTTRGALAYQARAALATRMALTDGTALADLATRMALTDGTALASLATRGPMIKQAPAYQAVIAQRLRSVKNGV